MSRDSFNLEATMTKILHIDSSSRGDSSVTHQLSQFLVETLKEREPALSVKHIDLHEQKPPFLDPVHIAAMYAPPPNRTAEQTKALDEISVYADDVLNNDVLVFGVPMYNFSVPAAFKAYIDLIVIAGKTFSFENGAPKALLKNKKGFVLTASGGNYAEPPYQAMDFVEPYLRAILGFIGITDLTFVKVHGHSPDEIAEGIARAKAQIKSLLSAVAV
jgi:FMN-dependent NADH-azoreductase